VSFSDLTDRAMKACRTTFGESVSYTPAGGSVSTIQGIFSAESVVVEGGLPVISKDPTLGIRKADLGDDFEPSQGDAVVIRTVSYVVTDFRDDGQGGVSLQLQRAT
jgi:hypothetical protein